MEFATGSRYCVKLWEQNKNKHGLCQNEDHSLVMIRTDCLKVILNKKMKTLRVGRRRKFKST
jgi:hypothetical protein